MVFDRYLRLFPLSSFAVALMNTSPEEHSVDVSFVNIFRDMVGQSLILLASVIPS